MIRLDTTGSGRWSTGNCARNFDLTIRTSGIYTTQNPFGERNVQNSLGYWDTHGSHNHSQTTGTSESKKWKTITPKKKKTKQNKTAE